MSKIAGDRLEQFLSIEQEDRFQGNIEEGRNLDAAITAMNLSTRQRQEMRQAFQATQDSLEKTISAEQARQVLENLRKK